MTAVGLAQTRYPVVTIMDLYRPPLRPRLFFIQPRGYFPRIDWAPTPVEAVTRALYRLPPSVQRVGTAIEVEAGSKVYFGQGKLEGRVCEVVFRSWFMVEVLTPNGRVIDKRPVLAREVTGVFGVAYLVTDGAMSTIPSYGLRGLP